MALTLPQRVRDLNTTLLDNFRELQKYQDPDIESLVMRVPSSTSQNDYAWLAAHMKARKWVGARHVKGITARTFFIKNEPYEATIGVNRYQLEDNDLVQFTTERDTVVDAMRKLPMDLVVDLLMNGRTAKAYDGQFFFDTDHPTNLDAVTGTQSNLFYSRALTPANFAYVRMQMRKYEGEYGRLGINPSELRVPPELEDAANRIAIAENVNEGGVSVSNLYRGSVTVKVMPQITDPNRWFLVDTSGPLKPLILQVRKLPEVVSKTALDDDNVFHNNEYIWGADARFGAGYGAWQKIAMATSDAS